MALLGEGGKFEEHRFKENEACGKGDSAVRLLSSEMLDKNQR